MKPRIVVVYSGSAEESAALAARCRSDAEIVTLSLDLGQGADLEEVRDRALAAGAVRAHVMDVRDEFAHEYILPALHAGALCDDGDPMGFALAARLVSGKLDEIAAIEQATPVAASSPAHDNLLGRQGVRYTLTRPPADAPQTPAEVEIAFERGIPLTINGVPMALTELIEILAIIAGSHGVGRIGDRASEAGDRACAEAPAGIVLRAAYKALAEAAGGDAVSGSVRIKLLRGAHTVVECRVDPRPADPQPPAPSPQP